MCGRFAQTTSSDDLVRLFQLVMGVEIVPRFNVAPTQDVVAIRSHADGRRAHWFRWGLVPRWSRDLRIGNKMINARSESIFDKRSFAEPARKQRCVIPASGFYEWRDTPAGKVPVLFSPTDGPVFRFAGLWSSWANDQGEVTCTTTILTTTANDTMAPFHHRMPVLLTAADCDTWLDSSQSEPDRLTPLLRTAPDHAVSFRPVSVRVNNVRNDDSACWEPYE